MCGPLPYVVVPLTRSWNDRVRLFSDGNSSGTTLLFFLFAGGQKPKKPKKINPIPAPSPPPVPIKQPQPVKNIPKEVTVEKPQEKIPKITPPQEEENLEVVESQILGTPRRKTHGLKKENQEKISEEKEDVSAIDMEVQEALDRAKKRSEEAKLTPKNPISSPTPRQKKKKTSSRGKTKTYQPSGPSF